MTLKAALEMVSLKEPESWSGGFYTGCSCRHVMHLYRKLGTENIVLFIANEQNIFPIRIHRNVLIYKVGNEI